MDWFMSIYGMWELLRENVKVKCIGEVANLLSNLSHKW